MSANSIPAPACVDLAPAWDTIPHIAWGASAGGAIDHLNRRGSEYTGIDAEAIVGKPWAWLTLLHPDDVGDARRGWQEALAAGAEIELEFRIRRADGVFRWFQARGVPARGDGGPPGRWFGTWTDIDEGRAAHQHQAQEIVTLLETAQAHAPIGWGFVDREARYVRVNERLAAINGVPKAEHPGRTIAEVVPHYWASIEPNYRRVLETGEQITHQPVTVPAATGPLQWLVSYYPIRVAGAITGVGFVVVDITANMAAEAFRTAGMDHMAEGLFTTDSEGRVTSLNRAAVRMLGWTEPELLGQPVHELLHAAPEGRGHAAGDCPVLLAGTTDQQVDAGEEFYARKDGTTLAVAYSASSVHVGQLVAGAVVVFRDITELKQRQWQELEGRHDQKLEALGRLSAGLAHEINTPIQFVGDNTRFLAEAYQTMLELLLVYRECLGPASGQELPWEERKRRAEDAEEKADIEYLAEEVPGAVEQSLEGIDRVASLVRAMKAFSYKDTKEHSYADLNEGIRTTVIVARNEVKYVADVVLDLGEVPDVLCHLGDLNQVFLNLLVNAADAMPTEGERGEIRISTRVEGSMVVIRFADNGTGIPEEIRKSIFDPFFTTKEVGKGTGQGLALASAVCEKHGGTIEVNSELGAGTEFVITLPISGRRGGTA